MQRTRPSAATARTTRTHSNFNTKATMLSLVTQKVTQKVLQQPSSANKKKQYEIHNVLGTGSFGKVVVRLSTPSSPPIDLTDSLPIIVKSVRHGQSQQSNLVSPSVVLPPHRTAMALPGLLQAANLPERGQASRRRWSPMRSH